MNEPLPQETPGKPKAHRLAMIYGAVMAGALFFVGWVTGLGGSFGPNLAFSVVMGALAALLFWLVIRRRQA